MAEETEFERQQKILNEITEKLKENKLLIHDGDKSKLDLKKFNKNLSLASENLGNIVPNIIEVSKEQVALVNNGLEGTINFIRAFQTFNTAFAVFVEKPDIFENRYKGRINELENLEERLINDVGDNLKNLDEMLSETFKEVAVYYTALANIIYSEDEGGFITGHYRRSSELKDKMKNIYERKDTSKTFVMKKSLGLVQIIQSLVDIKKDVDHIKLENGKEMKEYYINTSSKDKDARIKVDIDIIDALKNISGELINSLNNAGLFVKDENEKIQIIKTKALQQRYVSQSGKKAVENILENLKKHKKITEFFKNNFEKIKQLKKVEVKENEKAKLHEALVLEMHEGDNAKKVSDKIIKNQMDLIIEVVNAFGSVISLWGDQVTNEISIAQVADKAIISIDKLSQVQIKSGIENEDLLVAKKAQVAISKTCSYAKELKNVGKVMQMLLQRVKSLLSYNKGLESQIKQFYSGNTEMQNYRNSKLKEIKKLMYERYPQVSKQVSKTIESFNDKIKYLADKKNMGGNDKFFNKIIENYIRIRSSLINSTKLIKEKTSLIETDMSKFSESCIDLGKSLDKSDNQTDNFYDTFIKLKETYNDDFKVYLSISDDYREFVKGLSPMLDLMRYMISMEKQLGKDKIELRVINQSLKAFTLIFEENKKIQKEETQLDKELSKMMKQLGLSEKDYYKEYKKQLGDLKNMLEDLEKEVKDYFEGDKKQVTEAYNLANNWIGSFEVDFKDYNDKLKSLNIGFFEKLFKTQSYKEKDFWQELKVVKKSFDSMDNHISKLSKMNLKPGNDVPGFCKFSVTFVNEMMKGYEELIIEVARILGIMNLVNENLSKVQVTNITDFKNMIELVKESNEKLETLEKNTKNLEEFEPLNVDKILEIIKKFTDFSKLSDTSKDYLKDLNEAKDDIKSLINNLRNNLLVFYTTYLKQANLPEKEKKKYIEIYNEAKSKIK